LLKEEDRAQFYFQAETKTPLMNNSMFQHSKLDDLALMYRIFRRVESTLKYIIQKMQPYIEARGEKIVSDEALQKDPVEFT